MDMLNVQAWQADNPFRFIAMQFDLPNGAWRWASAEVTFDPGGGEALFETEHPDYGFVTGVGLIKDGMVQSALAPDLDLSPATGNGLIALDAAHGSLWRLWHGLVDPEGGGVIGEPVQWDMALLNRPRLTQDARRQALRFTSFREDQLILAEEDSPRLTDAFHQRVWPGELGLSQVINVNREVYVRASPPVKGGAGGGGGGVGGGGFEDMMNVVLR